MFSWIKGISVTILPSRIGMNVHWYSDIKENKFLRCCQKEQPTTVPSSDSPLYSQIPGIMHTECKIRRPMNTILSLVTIRKVSPPTNTNTLTEGHNIASALKSVAAILGYIMIINKSKRQLFPCQQEKLQGTMKEHDASWKIVYRQFSSFIWYLPKNLEK